MINGRRLIAASQNSKATMLLRYLNLIMTSLYASKTSRSMTCEKSPLNCILPVSDACRWQQRKLFSTRRSVKTTEIFLVAIKLSLMFHLAVVRCKKSITLFRFADVKKKLNGASDKFISSPSTLHAFPSATVRRCKR